jgi:stage II sporulation protein R
MEKNGYSLFCKEGIPVKFTWIKSRLARLEAAVLAGLVVAVVAALFGIQAEQRAIADSMVRLHIKAASDSRTDQELKLAVRDRVIGEVFEDFAPDTREEALSYFAASLDKIEDIAKSEVAARGYSYAVKAEIVSEDFPEKSYGIMSLPAGGYTALKIKIGDGQGENWWCVMFPPVCLQTSADLRVSSGLTNSQWNTVTRKPVIKFKVLELFAAVKKWFR